MSELIRLAHGTNGGRYKPAEILSYLVVFLGGLAITSRMSWLAELGGLAAILGLFVLLWTGFGEKWFREWQIKWPAKAALTDPITGKKCTTLILPEKSTHLVDLSFYVKTGFWQQQLKICFEGDKDSRPMITKYAPRLQKEEIRQTYTDNDEKDCFWIIGQIRRNPGPTRFRIGIKTNKPGIYPMQIYFFTDEGTGQIDNKLFIKVE